MSAVESQRCREYDGAGSSCRTLRRGLDWDPDSTWLNCDRRGCFDEHQAVCRTIGDEISMTRLRGRE